MAAHQKRALFFISSLIVFLLACVATLDVGVATPTVPAPSETSSPTLIPTAPPLSSQVTLTSIPFNEASRGPRFPPYTLDAQIPQLTGSDDPRVLTFNQRLNELVMHEVTLFRQNFQQLTVTPLSTGSSLDVTYTLAAQIGDLWSFKFDFNFYADAAAHPGLNSVTLNYDLAHGRELLLSDLFMPGANYLDVISAYCTAEVQKLAFGDIFVTEGTKPTPENYRNWNITLDGLVITFDAYQVAPGAAGPQQVVVPYSELAAIMDPQGPLAFVLR